MKNKSMGVVVGALGNLIQVKFQEMIVQGCVVYLDCEGDRIKGEVIEIRGQIAKIQVFEDIKGLKSGDQVEFLDELLEVELGPGLLSQIFDGLQNPLDKLSDATGLFLKRGCHIQPLDRVKKWMFTPCTNIGECCTRGMSLGVVQESRFDHQIMVPFKYFDQYTVEWIAPEGQYTLNDTIARLKDTQGETHQVYMVQKWPIKKPLIEGKKVEPQNPLTTGIRIVDTLTPLLQGSTACSPGPFGAGKTVIQHLIAKYANVDIVVMCACGERAGEVVETLRTFPKLVDVHTGESLMKRTIIICNTSSMPVAAREASVYVGMTVSEYYRQMGLNVMLLADSTSRWAQAMREMSGRLEEIPGDEAFPAYLSTRIAAFYERSGCVKTPSNRIGSVTTIGAVSPAGGNITSDPVSTATLAVVGAFICLSREFSDARKYPAIDVLKSWSKYLKKASSLKKDVAKEWYEWVQKALNIMAKGDEIGRRLQVVGQEGTNIEDLVLYYKMELFSFSYLQQNAFDKEDVYCPDQRQIELFVLIQHVFDAPMHFNNGDSAKEALLLLQNKIKNMNFLPFPSESYTIAKKEIVAAIEKLREKQEV